MMMEPDLRNPARAMSAFSPCRGPFIPGQLHTFDERAGSLSVKPVEADEMISREDMRSSVDDGFAAEAVCGDAAFHFESVDHPPELQLPRRIRGEGSPLTQTNIARFDPRRFHGRFQRFSSDVLVDGMSQRRPPCCATSLEVFFDSSARLARVFEFVTQEVLRGPGKVDVLGRKRLRQRIIR